MSETASSSPASRRSFIRQGTAAAVALPAVVSTLVACGETKAIAVPSKDPKPATPPPPSAQQKADQMDAMHESGGQGVPGDDRGQGQPADGAAAGGAVKVYDLTARGDPVGGGAGQEGEGLGVQRAGARAADPRSARATGCASTSRTSCPESTVDPLPRPRGAQRPGRRAVHHAAADQAGRDATPMSSPCPTPARTCTTRTTTRRSQVVIGLLGAFIVEPKRPPPLGQGGRRLRHDPQ